MMSTKQKRIDAETRANQWLSIYNDYVETGKEHLKSATTAWRKAQYWLDRLNRLEGKGVGN